MRVRHIPVPCTIAFFAWCEACAHNFLQAVGNLQFPLSSPSVPTPKDLVAGPVSLLSCLGCCHPCMKHFLLVVVTVTGTNRFFDIVKSRQQKGCGTTSTTPSPPNSTPPTAATSNTSSSTGSAKPKPQAKAKKRPLAFATPSPVPKKSPKMKQTASPELLAKWLRQFPWPRFDEQRGLYCFFYFKHRDNVQVQGTGRPGHRAQLVYHAKETLGVK